jgi:hypothetical protein
MIRRTSARGGDFGASHGSTVLLTSQRSRGVRGLVCTGTGRHCPSVMLGRIKMICKKKQETKVQAQSGGRDLRNEISEVLGLIVVYVSPNSPKERRLGNKYRVRRL